MLWGVCVNAQHDAWPQAQEVHLLGAQLVRTIVYDLDGFDAVLSQQPSVVPVVALLNQETAGVGDDLSGWGAVVLEFCQRFAGRVLAIECLNEWDLQGIEPARAAQCAADALQLAAGIRMAPRILLGSVAGENWIQALHDAVDALEPKVAARLAGVCVHPYGQRAAGYPDGWGFGELEQAVLTAHGIAHRPVWLTEYGINLNDVDGDEESQARYLVRARRLLAAMPSSVCMAATQFAWNDTVGSAGEQFGLRLADDTPRLAWGSMMAMSGVA